MKRFLLQTILLVSVPFAFAFNTAELINDEAALKVLNRKCIRLGTSEVLPIRFETAVAILSGDELIEQVQAEFGRTISKDGTVDFPIIQDSPGVYHYVNENGKRTDLREIYRKQTDNVSYNYIVQANGQRFFGGYDVIIHLQIVDLKEMGIAYSVAVHAWPRNWLTRTSHRIGLTQDYFRRKMKLISWVAREIALGLSEQEELKNELEEQALSRPEDDTAVVPPKEM
jgi:hypothetical protein